MDALARATEYTETLQAGGSHPWRKAKALPEDEGDEEEGSSSLMEDSEAKAERKRPKDAIRKGGDEAGAAGGQGQGSKKERKKAKERERKKRRRSETTG